MLPAVCARLLPARAAVLIGAVAIAGPAAARTDGPPGSLYEVPLPGGVAAAMKIVDDRAAPDRGHFLLDFIRRTYDTPAAPKADRRAPIIRALVAHLDLAAAQPAAATETVPLPLAPEIWNDVVFARQPPSPGLVSSILQSRNAALLYRGLLSLDDATRAWLATERDLVADLASKYAAALTAAAPGLRIDAGTLHLPGGDAAASAWENLVGQRRTKPAEFVRALLAQEEGRVAAFLGAVAQLTPAQIRAALRLDAAEQTRGDAARRLYAVFERTVPAWRIDERTFWRPVLDPVMLIAELPTDADGRPRLAGTRAFWAAVFADEVRLHGKGDEQTRALATGDPIDLLSLCEQVFVEDLTELRRRHHVALFASRILGSPAALAPETVRDSIEAVRGAAEYPALVAVLERARIADVGAYAAAVRRAARLSAIADTRRAVRAIAQFQGALALVARAATRGGLRADAARDLVASLAAVDVSEAGDYEGRLVRWITTHLAPGRETETTTLEMTEAVAVAGGPVEQRLLRVLAASGPVAPPFVDWEGTRYRLDPAWAEATRLMRLLGEDSLPSLSSAVAIVRVSDALAGATVTADELRRQPDALQHVGESLGWDREGQDSGVVGRYRELSGALRRAARDGDSRAASRLVTGLRVLADDLLARGLEELAYAVALGEPDRAVISAGEAASRHDYGIDSGGVRRGAASWRMPLAGATMHGWRVTGALLGLDVRLAEFALRRVTSRPPPRKPTLNDEDRRVLTEAAVLAEPTLLRAAEHEAIVAAIRRGRVRLAQTRTVADAAAIAEQIRLGPLRRTLLPWVVLHDAERLAAFLSPSELFWLGLEPMPWDAAFHAWGAPAEPRGGCICLRMPDRRSWETFAGRWNTGILASGFADLNLRLAELLAELRMPAPLLAAVLPAATLDVVNQAASRDQDDRRALVEYVQSLGVERVEQYLALLTTDGPLVPVEEVALTSPRAAVGLPERTPAGVR